MGYTHYWERPVVLPRPQFAAAAADCRRLCQVLAIPLNGAAGDHEPEFSAERICFNGAAAAEGCEPFVMPRTASVRHQDQQSVSAWLSDFCKTNHRPYDLCVQGCLIFLGHHLGSASFRVSSDGSTQDWDAARDACQRILGYGDGWGNDRLVPLLPQPVA